MSNAPVPAPAQAQTGVTAREVRLIVSPWRWLLLLVLASVLLGATLELVPPLVIRRVVDDHVSLGRSQGLLLLAGLYLGATALAQAMSFVTDYVTSIVAQGALHGFACPPLRSPPEAAGGVLRSHAAGRHH